MPKIMCPKCKTTEMEKNEHGVYVCPKCNAVFMQEKPKKSIFGVT